MFGSRAEPKADPGENRGAEMIYERLIKDAGSYANTLMSGDQFIRRLITALEGTLEEGASTTGLLRAETEKRASLEKQLEEAERARDKLRSDIEAISEREAATGRWGAAMEPAMREASSYIEQLDKEVDDLQTELEKAREDTAALKALILATIDGEGL